MVDQMTLDDALILNDIILIRKALSKHNLPSRQSLELAIKAGNHEVVETLLLLGATISENSLEICLLQNFSHYQDALLMCKVLINAGAKITEKVLSLALEKNIPIEILC